jgi:hypothetical protein
MDVVRQFARGVTAVVLAGSLCWCSRASAQSHIVSPAELHSAVQTAAQARQENVGAVVSVLSTPLVEKALGSAHIDASQVKTAIAALSDDGLARLAVRANSLQSDIAAGRLTERDLLLILVGLAALILIIVAVD